VAKGRLILVFLRLLLYLFGKYRLGAVVKLKLKPGDTVRIVGERGTAKVRAILTSVHGALLERKIGRFRVWNLDELRLVRRGKVKRSKLN
jgi:hypothetical protein